MNSDTPETLIDLSKRADVQALDFQELIQKGAMTRLATLLTRRVDAASQQLSGASQGEKMEDDGSPLFLDRRHGTILIHGGRGSGKTTFIRNAFHLIRQGSKPFGQMNQRVAILGVVDPTLIENKENIFIIVVNKIRQAVEKVRKERGEKGAGLVGYKDWKQTLQDMAHGLTLLDGIGSDRPMGDGWEDAHYVVDKGLEKAQAGSNLELRFHEFVRKSLRFVGKDAFVMALDDIDTDFQRGWPVLEVLRRYLTSPQFVVLMSGDMDLYAMLVRGRHWSNFDEKHLRYDRDQKRPIIKMVSHLQNQYLLKLLQPQNRIGLRPLTQLDHSNIWVKSPLDTNIQVVKSPQDEELQPLNKFLDALVQKGLGQSGPAARDIVSMLLHLPLRTVMQLMLVHGERDSEYSISQQLAPIFTDVMLRFNLSPDELQEASGGQFLVRLVKFLTENGLWSTAHTLHPDHQDDDLNQTLLVLSVQLTELFKAQPHLALTYMIQIALAREVLVTRLPNLSRGPEQFIDYTEIDRHRSLTGMAGRLMASIGATENMGLNLGIVQTRKRAGRNTKIFIQQMYGEPPTLKGDFKEIKTHLKNYWSAISEQITSNHAQKQPNLGIYYNTIDSMIDRLPSRLMQDLASLPVCNVLTPVGNRPTYVSAYRLVAIVGRLLEPGAADTMQDLQRLLSAEGLIRDYPLPPWLAGDRPAPPSNRKAVDGTDDDDDNDEEQDNATAEIVDLKNSEFLGVMLQWRKQARLGEPMLPAALARVMTRYFYALAAMNDKVPPSDRFLGHLLHRQIIAFFNALLIEESSFRGIPINLDFRNAITSDAVFNYNFSLLYNEKILQSSLPLFWAIFSCPLWPAYLDPNSQAFRNSTSEHSQAIYDFYSVDYLIAKSKPPHFLGTEQGRGKAEGANDVHVSFKNLYDLYNSVTVIGVDVRSASQRKAQKAKPE